MKSKQSPVAVKLEQRGRITLICANPQAAIDIAIKRQNPMGWVGGVVPKLYSKTFIERLNAGQVVWYGECDKEPLVMYPAQFANVRQANLADVS